MIIVFQLLFIVVFALSFPLSYCLHKRFLSSVTLFSFAWCFLPLLSTFGINGLFIPGDKVYLYILLGVVSFYFFYLLSFAFLRSRKNTKRFENSYSLLSKPLFAFNLLGTLILLPSSIKSFQIALTYGYQYLRENASVALTSSVLLQNLYNWLLLPLFLASACLIISDFLVNDKKPNKKLLCVVIINIVLHSITFAARAAIVKVIMYALFALFFSNNKKGLTNRRNSFYIIFASILMLSFTIYLTAGRMEQNYSDYSFIDSIVMYYVGPFVLLNHHVNNWSILHGSGSYLFGRGTFGFVTNLFEAAAYFFVPNGDYFGTDYIIGKETEYFTRVGTNIYMNSANTSIYTFLRDFGIFGIVLGFGLLAVAIGFVEIKDRKEKSLRYKALYIYLLYFLFKTVMNYEAVSPSVFFALFFIFLFTKQRQNYRNDCIQRF